MRERLFGSSNQHEREKEPSSLRPIAHDSMNRPAEEGRESEDHVFDNDFTIFVADGLSSSERPDIASDIASDIFFEKTADLPWETTTKRVEIALKSAWNESVLRLHAYKLHYQMERDTATTITVAHVFEENGQANVSWLQSGHSRLYALTDKGLEQLTPDHFQPYDMGITYSMDDSSQEIAHMDPFLAIDERDRNRWIVTKMLSSNGKMSIGGDTASYELYTQPLPKGTIALIAQTIGVHGALSAQEQAAAIRGARSIQDAHSRILEAVATKIEQAQKEAADPLYFDAPRVNPKDASIAILQFEPFPKKILIPRPPWKKIGLATTGTIAVAITVCSFRQAGMEPPPPPPPTISGSPTPEGSLRNSNEHTSSLSDVYGNTPLSYYHPGDIRVDMSKKGGLRIRTSPSTTEANSINPSSITAINDEEIDINRGIDTFAVHNVPVVQEEDSPNADPWLVFMATTSDGRKIPVYINAGNATKGVVDTISSDGNITHEPITTQKVTTKAGQRMDETGAIVTLGTISIR